MSNLYKHVLPDGRTIYTDRPSTTDGGSLKSFRPNQPEVREKTPEELRDERVKKVIKKASSVPAKAELYLAYASYLRHHNAIGHRRMLAALKASHPAAYAKLQKYPEFRPLGETLIGLKAGEKNLGAAVSLANSDFSGGAQRWFETTMKDMMKKDRFGPFSDVLTQKAAAAAKASKPALAADLAYNARAAAAVAKDVKASTDMVRTARAGAFTRFGGSIFDVFAELLKPSTATTGGILVLDHRRKKLIRAGALTDEEQELAQQLLSQERYPEMTKLMDDAERRFVYGK